MTALLAFAAFLLGSIPCGAIIARTRGINLREVGSGNIGATNVLRSAGKIPALLTLAGDMAKGAVATWAAAAVLRDPVPVGIVGLAAVAGHVFSVFLRFRGGKGVATALGVILVYAPPAGLATIGVWLIAAAITRYSSLAAVLSFLVLPFTMHVVDGTREKVLMTVPLAALLIIKHAANIKRLIGGTESKIGERVR